MYTGYYHENTVIIAQALNFVSERMKAFFDAQKLAVDISHHVLIDKEYAQKVQSMDAVREFLAKADNVGFVRLDEQVRKTYLNIIRSALEIYLQDTLDAKAKTGLTTFDTKIEEIRQAMNIGDLKTSETKLFKEYYQLPPASPEGGKIEIFLSYAHNDKTLAGRIGSLLHGRDIDVFLAHEDIEVSEEWRKEILKHLENDRFLVALLTPSYEKSVWANQEAGYMIGKGGKTIPLIVEGTDIKKFGFLESLQGILIQEAELNACIDKIIDAASR